MYQINVFINKLLIVLQKYKKILLYHDLIRKFARRRVKRVILRGFHHHEIHRLERLLLSYGEGYLALLSLCHRRVDTRIVIGSHAHQSVAIAIAAQCLKRHGQLLARLWHNQANGVKSIVLWQCAPWKVYFI